MIRNQTYLITVDDFKAETAVEGHTTDFDNKVLVAIRNSQKRLESIICESQYADFLSAYANSQLEIDPIPLTPEYSALLPYLQEYTVWKAYQLWIPTSGINSTEVGYRNFNDENSTAVSSATLKQLTEYSKEQVAWYEAELRNFLFNNIDDYPLYKDSGCNSCKPNKTYSKISGAGSNKIKHKSFRLYR